MAAVFDVLDESLQEFIRRQQMFFVATAPLAAEGLINLSPKGLDTLRILDELTVAYADLTGSGVETIAHLKENGRIALMFCAFEGSPKIVRLHGRGEVIERTHADFETLQQLFPTYTGLRSFIRVHCRRISDSCGWSVPLYEFREQRQQLVAWSDKQGAEAIAEYRQTENQQSLNGLPGVDVASTG